MDEEWTDNNEEEDIIEQALTDDFNKRLARISEFYRIAPTDVLHLLEGHVDACSQKFNEGYKHGQDELLVQLEIKKMEKE